VLPNALGKDQQSKYAELSAVAGIQFDKQFVAAVKESHKNDIDAFEDMSKEAYDGDIRGFAAKFLPTLEQHLKDVDAVEDEIEKLP
jgi:putative membrane protein